jgi:hypothetical protein
MLAPMAVTSVRALESVAFYSSPGPTANGVTAYMDCGWHEVCVAPNEVGTGLDWRNAAGHSVQFQGWGYRDVGGTPLRIGTVYVGQRNGYCLNTAADIVDTFGNYIGRVNYTHSSLAVAEGSSRYIYARDAGYWNQWVGIATTVHHTADLGTCTNTGAHLHQRASDGAWTKYGSYPNEDGARGIARDITLPANAMNYTSWAS